MKLKISTTIDLTDENLDKWYKHYARPNEYRWEWGDDVIICAKTKEELRGKVIDFFKEEGYDIVYSFA